jgi:predicted CxxxxCH...CXXCH cytochrome family protein
MHAVPYKMNLLMVLRELPGSSAKVRCGPLSLALVAILLVSGCSQLQDNLVAPPQRNQSLAVHPVGWATTISSDDFHGKYLRRQQWQMSSCWTCHGRNYGGGDSQVSCSTCHIKPGGPENCTTCHGSTNPAPPPDLDGNTAITIQTVGAHQSHIAGAGNTDGIRCSECHNVPATVYVAGHVDSGPPAEVLFHDSLANTVTNEPTTRDYDVSLPTTTPTPTWDSSVLKCSNTYCHGDFKNGNNYSPAWTSVGTGEARCGTCHGDVTKQTLAERALPKTPARGGTHPNSTQCSFCHVGIVDANLNIIDKAKHMNGKLNVFGDERDF